MDNINFSLVKVLNINQVRYEFVSLPGDSMLTYEIRLKYEVHSLKDNCKNNCTDNW